MKKEDIIIKQLPEGGFDVIYGDKRTDHIGYDEVLGIVSAITMPDNRPCLHWLQTEAQHQAFKEKYCRQDTKLEGWQKMLPAKDVELKIY